MEKEDHKISLNISSMKTYNISHYTLILPDALIGAFSPSKDSNSAKMWEPTEVAPLPDDERGAPN